jgi:hypothetical protein
MRKLILLLLLGSALAACQGDAEDACRDLCLEKAADAERCQRACESRDVAAADVVVEAPGDTGEGFGDAQHAVNGVRGCGDTCGSTDVFSLGLTPGVDDYVVLRWSGRRVLNGPGADFVVFENAFLRGGGPDRFIDPVVVFVSRDGVTWVPFPHDYTAPDETAYSYDPASWPGFAGLGPVRLHAEDNPVDPFDAEAAGGDGFDLDELPDDDAEAAAIKSEGFVYLKLVSAAAHENPDTGAPYPKEPISNGPDIDGVYGRWLAVE